MNERLISKFIVSDLIESGSCSYAIADLGGKLVWFNKRFKNDIKSNRIKGKTISELFKQQIPSEIRKNFIGNIKISESSTEYFINISLLKVKGKIQGYLIKLEKVQAEIFPEKSLPETSSFQFPQTLQQILTLFLKEKSLAVLSEEILKRCIEICSGSYGLVIFNNEDSPKLDYQFFDPGEAIKNKDEVSKTIESSTPYIFKWLDVNRRPLVVKNVPGSMGYNIIQILRCSSAIIAPCFFDENLLASIVIAANTDNFSEAEVNNAGQFAALLSFTISSVRTRELNAALESRLLQSQKLETIGKLSSGMAHDFSNLLSSIFGSLNLLKKKIPEREDIYRLLDNIENCSIRAKDLTKGLLSFGKPTPKRKELIKPNQLLSEISKVITQTFPAKIIFEKEISSSLYDILGNGTEIYQVLLNLCVNAKEAIDGKGKIVLRAQNIKINDSNILSHPLLDSGNFVWFSVEDSGAGIKEENITRIFDPYFSTKDKQSGSGSGLGLYVTYGIVKAHKGHIEVSSELNKGTTFDVFIPAFEPAAAAKQAPADRIILLADDEIMLRDLLSELLESSGYNVVKVSTGVEALKVLTEEIKVNLAIIDYNMPEMDGLECIKRIRKLQFKMPIILSSGSISLDERIDFKSLGISGVLSKPYEFETLLSTIQKLL